MCVWPVCCHQDGEAELQRLTSEMRAEEDRHKRELETVQQQCRREVEDAHKERFNQCKAYQNIQYTEIVFSGILTHYYVQNNGPEILM